MGQETSGGLIQLSMRLPAKITKKRNLFVSLCPVLDVCSQGDTIEEAKSNLIEAITVFIISCVNRGTLEEVLKGCGFSPLQGEFVKQKEVRGIDYIDVPIPIFSAPPENRCHA